MLWSCTSLLLTAVAIIAYSAVSIRDQAIHEKKSQIRQDSTGLKRSIESFLRAGLSSAETLAETMGAVKDESLHFRIGREEAASIIGISLQGQPFFHAAYTIWESDAFDSLDIGYASAPGHDDTGRFAVYWRRDAEGKPQMTSAYRVRGYPDGFEPSAIFEESKGLTGPLITSPFTFSSGVDQKFLATIVVPVVHGDTFYGLIGLELDLSSIQNVIEQARIGQSLFSATVISKQGTIIARTGDAQSNGTNAEAELQSWGLSLEKLSSETLLETSNHLLVSSRVHFTRTTSPWHVIIRIPSSEITQKGSALMWQQIAICVACVILAILLQWVSVSGIVSRKVSSETEHLRDASSKLRNESSSQLERMQRQTSAVASISETITELSQVATTVARSSERASDIVADTLHQCELGGQASEKVQGSTSTVIEQVGHISDLMSLLNQSAQEINVATEIIKELSEQTSILSYNAEIEAASAGSAGKGFTVVANQVGKLAQRARDSSRQVSTLIGRVQTLTDTTLSATRKVSRAVQDSSEAQTQMQILFNEIENHFSSVLNTTREINAASSEQSTSASRVQESIHSVLAATRDTEKSSAGLLATAESLSHVVEQLRRI